MGWRGLVPAVLPVGVAWFVELSGVGGQRTRLWVEECRGAENTFVGGGVICNAPVLTYLLHVLCCTPGVHILAVHNL